MKTIPLALAAYSVADRWYGRELYNHPWVDQEPPAKWWTEGGTDTKWCGVFQGGGAKAAAYGGALLSWYESGQWFDEVSGASAGAITAALIAAGLHPKEVILLGEVLLRKIKPSTRIDRVLNRTPLTRPFVRYSLSDLERTLDEVLTMGLRRHGGKARSNITFAQLYEATGIRLTVVVLDTSAGRPIPFCEQWTPDMPIAAAVCASCSIPVVFEPLFVEMEPNLSDRWRRLADGGVFANFPSFVFSDEDYRRYFNLGRLDEALRTVGFVLGYPDPVADDAAPARFVTNPKNILTQKQISAGHQKPSWQTVKGLEPVRGMLDLLRIAELVDDATSARAMDKAQRHFINRKIFVEMLPLTFLSIMQVAGLIGIVLLGWRGVTQIQEGRTSEGVVTLILVAVCILLFMLLRSFALRVIGEGLQVLSVWSGLALRPPAWMGHGSEERFIVHVPVVMLGTTAFDVGGHEIRISNFLSYLKCGGQIEFITGTGEDEEDPAEPERNWFNEGLASLTAQQRCGVEALPSHPYERPRWVKIKDFLLQ